MASMLKKAILYLGLGPDEEYDSYASYAATESAGEDQPELVLDQPASSPVAAGTGTVRPVPDVEPSSVATTPERPAGSPVVRTLPPIASAKPSTVTPVSFNDAQEIGDRYQSKQPVIVNLQNADRELSRRLLDFASGLCYGLGGEMERVANHVYLLTPADVELAEDDRARLLGGD